LDAGENHRRFLLRVFRWVADNRDSFEEYTMSEYTIYHNPRCSKSRQTLQLLRDHDFDVEIVEYLKEPPTHSELRQIVRALGIPARELIRRKEKLFAEVGDAGIRYSDSAAINLLAEHPRLIERPIVLRGQRAVIGRPPENILTLVDGQ
jgi:arsenate reductase